MIAIMQIQIQSITLYKVCAHANIEGNERADKLTHYRNFESH